MEADFSGYATKTGLKCSDGRTIMPDAFKHQHEAQVPLVWQHVHDSPDNILGYAVLQHREDGVYCYGYFNDTAQAQTAKQLLQHGDINSLSIYANKLVEKARNGVKEVLHGAIREVSLVLSGANPGALIDHVAIKHGEGPDGVEVLDDEAIIYTGLTLEHSDEEDEVVEHAEGDEKTLNDVYSTLNEEQLALVHFMIGAALEEAGVKHSDDSDDVDASEEETESEPSEDDPSDETSDEDQHDETDTTEGQDLAHQEGTTDMTNRVFEKNDVVTGSDTGTGPTLSHDQLKTIVETAQKPGETLKTAFLAHAAAYGITDIDLLFPDAKTVTSQPELISRRTEWVAGIIDGAKHSPFSRIKSLAADLTADEARARGYVKGNLKKDEVIRLLKRVTTPTTVYKKQKLDRDDVIDITDLDIVAWLKWEMRFMLEEELARAILIGDGREPDDEDKIDEERLRPIAWDDDMYAHKVTIPSNSSPEATVEAVIRARKHYKGTGRPTFYTTEDIITDFLMIRDRMGRYVYEDEQAVANKLRVTRLVPVEVMEQTPDLLGVMVNIADYTIGADRGGQLSMFDDFDIDYNQLKYLMETRVSGALTKPKSAVVVRRTSGTTVTPIAPTFNEDTDTLTVPTVTGVTYYDVTDDETGTVLPAGDTVLTRTTDVEARPDAGYSFPHNTDNDYTYAVTS